MITATDTSFTTESRPVDDDWATASMIHVVETVCRSSGDEVSG